MTMSGVEQSEEQWHVQVEAGDVRLWTLDQLDAAFKAELVDESTFVLEVGKTEWMQLGTLLGGDGDDEPAPSEVAPAHAPIAPVMFSETPGPMSLGPYSTAPMASDIDDFDSPDSFRGSRKRPIAIGIGVALLAAGIAVFGFVRGGISAAPDAAAAVAVATPAPAPVPPPPAPAADPPAQDPSSLAARLSHEQLEKLADADRARQAKLAAQQKTRAAAAPHHTHRTKEKGPFHSGGDKYDPLNAKL
jgi:hypothetical protein